MQSSSAEEQINDMERKIYKLLDEVNGLPKDDIDECTLFHGRIKALIKEMALCHSVLRKKIEEQAKNVLNKKKPSSQDTVTEGHLLNRLEDLQENAVDFEHNFCNKFPVRRDLGDKARDLYKDMKLREAQEKHRNASSSLFEL